MGKWKVGQGVEYRDENGLCKFCGTLSVKSHTCHGGVCAHCQVVSDKLNQHHKTCPQIKLDAFLAKATGPILRHPHWCDGCGLPFMHKLSPYKAECCKTFVPKMICAECTEVKPPFKQLCKHCLEVSLSQTNYEPLETEYQIAHA